MPICGKIKNKKDNKAEKVLVKEKEEKALVKKKVNKSKLIKILLYPIVLMSMMLPLCCQFLPLCLDCTNIRRAWMMSSRELKDKGYERDENAFVENALGFNKFWNCGAICCTSSETVAKKKVEHRRNFIDAKNTQYQWNMNIMIDNLFAKIRKEGDKEDKLRRKIENKLNSIINLPENQKIIQESSKGLTADVEIVSARIKAKTEIASIEHDNLASLEVKDLRKILGLDPA